MDATQPAGWAQSALQGPTRGFAVLIYSAVAGKHLLAENSSAKICYSISDF